MEVELIPTDGLPGIWAYHDAGAPMTIVIYMMYDTQPGRKNVGLSLQIQGRCVVLFLGLSLGHFAR